MSYVSDHRGHLLCIGGLPGVGKTTLAHNLCSHFENSVNICPDLTRLKVMGRDLERDVVTNDDLTPDLTVRTIATMKSEVEEALLAGKLVVIGSAFIGEGMRKEYTKMVYDLGCGFDGIWLDVDESVRADRADKRLAEYSERKRSDLDRGFNASAVVVDVESVSSPEGCVDWERVDASGDEKHVFSVVLEKMNHLNRLVR